MAMLVSDIITRAKQVYPDLSSAIALQYFNHIHNELMHRLNIRPARQSLSLTAGTAVYDLTGTRAFDAVYKTSSTKETSLSIVTWDWMDDHHPGWQSSDEQGTPSTIVISAENDSSGGLKGSKFTVRVFPVPDTTTSGGYPVIDIRSLKYDDLLTTDTIPATIQDEQVYVAGIVYKHANAQRYAEEDKAFQDYEQLVHRAFMYVQKASPVNTISSFPSALGRWR